LGFYLTWNGYFRKVETLIIAEFYRYLKFNEIINNGKKCENLEDEISIEIP